MTPDAGTGRPLRIAVVHSFYSSRQPSGENVVVDLQVAALRRAGHDVRLVARRVDDLEHLRSYPLLAGATVASGRGPTPRAELDAFAPDVVHVHNLFPNFGRTWVRAYAGRLVATLHNYRPVCPAGTLFRDGGACTLCPDGRSARPAVTHRCYKDSAVATAAVAIGTRFAADPLLAAADRIITLNDDMRSRYAAVGVDADRLVTVPNFVEAPLAGEHGGEPGGEYSGEPGGEHSGAGRGDHWMFVGRLSEEKGILPLVRDWPVGPRLLVVGSGELEAEVAAAAGPTVELLGQQPQARVRELMGSARGLFFPSLWPEGLPTVYLEALAAGLPVVASPQSVVGGLVRSEGTGFVTSGSVADDVARATIEFPRVRARCRAAYDARYTESAWLAAVDDVYRSLPGCAT